MNLFKHTLFNFLILVMCPYTTWAFIEGLYCGKQNCYDVLGVSRDVTKGDLARAYRQLAAKNHPDRHKSKEAKEKAAEAFTLIATAYEVLKDEDSRRDYDYMLENPDEIYRHYFSYYRNRMTPKVDPKIVVAVAITIISVIQYWSAWVRYKQAIDYIVTVPKYRLQAQEIAKQEGLIGNLKKKDRRPKEVVKDEEEQILKKIISEKLDIKGGYSLPSVSDILWLQLIRLPYTAVLWIWFYLRWFVKFTVQGCPYGETEKLYLIRRNLKMSPAQFEALPEDEIRKFMSKSLWLAENFKVWNEKRNDEMKVKLAESARQKSYRRFMKKHGPGKITFDD